MGSGYLNNLIHKKANWIVFILLVLLALQAVSSMQKKTLLVDEHIFLTRGYTYLKTGQLFVLGHTPFMHVAASLPLLFLDLEMPPNPEKYILINDYTTYTNKFFYEYNEDKVEQMVFWGRIPIVILSILLGFFVFRWSKELYGIKAGLLALFLYSFSPNILAYSRLAITDLGFSCFMFIAVYYFWKFVNDITLKHLLLSGTALGLALVSKFTALSLIPIFAILIFISIIAPNNLLSSRKTLKKIGFMLYSFGMILIVGLVIINLTYYFQGSFKSLGQNLRDDKADYFDHDVFNTENIVDTAIPFENKIIKGIGYFAIENFPIIAPYPYIKSFVSIIKQVPMPAYFYFMGKNAADIRGYAYILAFLIKTPIPTSILLLLSAIFFTRIKSKNTLNEYFLIVPVAFIMIYFSFFFSTKGLLKYILLIYPFIFVFASKVINLRIRKQILVYSGLGVLCLWYLFSSLSVYPHYLAYSNEFIGGPDNAYKYLSNYNLGVGQDLKGLGEYVKKKGISKINLAYDGFTSPDYYGIPHNYLKDDYWIDSIEYCSPVKGIAAVSPNYLQGMGLNNPACFDWLKDYEPIDKIGYSILIYNITGEGGG